MPLSNRQLQLNRMFAAGYEGDERARVRYLVERRSCSFEKLQDAYDRGINARKRHDVVQAAIKKASPNELKKDSEKS